MAAFSSEKTTERFLTDTPLSMENKEQRPDRKGKTTAFVEVLYSSI
jgi:hypothetical protein